ncbi:EAL domain-containing protein [Marinobacteraceae bacterium S3BR75-40.1]
MDKAALKNLRASVCLPLCLALAAIVWGLVMDTTIAPVPEGPVATALPTTSAKPVALGPIRYHRGDLPLDTLTASASWNWPLLPPDQQGLGYLSEPVVFAVEVSNPTDQDRAAFVLMDAPSMDRIEARSLDQDGHLIPLATLGDTQRAVQREIDLPQWIWPLQLAARETRTLYFEVTSSGPMLFPLQVHTARSLMSETATNLTWKSMLYGILLLTLLANVGTLFVVRSLAVAWLCVFLLASAHAQLVLDGFGAWLLWPGIPQISQLLSVTPGLAVLAFLQFSVHFLSVWGWQKIVLNTFSAAALVILVLTPLPADWFGQGALLLLGLAGAAFAFWLALRQHRQDRYARYFVVATTALFLGLAMVSLRTIGLLPVNELTNSGVNLGLAAVSVILTLGILRNLLAERRIRDRIQMQAEEEQRLRSLLQAENDRLLRTHRITGRPNRTVLEEKLSALDAEGTPFALCVLWLENHTGAESLLGYQWVESALRDHLQELDSLLLREFGGAIERIDNQALASIDTSHHAFIIRYDGPSPMDSPDTFWQRLHNGIDGLSTRESPNLDWMPSLGVAFCPEHSRLAWELIACASFAALQGHRSMTVYDANVAQRQQKLQLLMLDLDRALGNGDIGLVYQPKLELDHNRVSACEALIRWQHPEFGQVSPGLWIPFAEQTGAIRKVTLWVIARACRDLAALEAQYGSPLQVAVNISARDLEGRDFPDQILGAVEREGVRPHQVILEVTETAVATDPQHAHAILAELAAMGFHLALDDFGTGQSSLSALAAFSLDELKLDRSFLDSITSDPNRQRVFRTAIKLGRSLGLKIVVEGIEDAATDAWVRQFSGICGQGFFYGRPEPIAMPQQDKMQQFL